MDRDLAKQLLDAAINLETGLGEIDDVISKLEDSELKTRLYNALKAIFGTLFIEIMNPALKVYPELNPGRDHS